MMASYFHSLPEFCDESYTEAEGHKHTKSKSYTLIPRICTYIYNVRAYPMMASYFHSLAEFCDESYTEAEGSTRKEFHSLYISILKNTHTHICAYIT